MNDIFADFDVEKIADRVLSRFTKRGFLTSEYYQTHSSGPNPLLASFEAELRSLSEAGECEHCEYMVKSLSDTGFLGWRVKLDFPSLESCAGSCSLCSFILAFIEQDVSFMEIVRNSSTALRIVSNFVGTISNRGTDNDLDASKESNGIYPQLTATFAPNLDFKNVTFGMGGLSWPIHEGGMLPFEDSSSGSTSTGKPFTGRLVKEETDCNLLSSWLKICRDHHGHTCESNTLAVPPDVQLRMIDVTQQCVVPAQPGAEYAALSYVWGEKPKGDRLVLTKETYPRLAKAGGLAPDKDDVPQTFRDAIALVHQLGYMYLWIDTLCIQQDDPADLEAQMSTMDEIYGCALLTVVCDTTSSDSGLPGLRPNTRVVNQRLYKGDHVSLITTRRPPWSESETSPWSTRGWTLQEDILSKRLLVFTSGQVFYNCRSATFVEHTIQETSSGPHLPALDVMKGKQITKDSFFWRRTRQFQDRDPSDDELHEIKPFTPLEEYRALLHAYTQRHLTNNGDTINAFSGILKSMSPTLGDHFWGLPVRYFTQLMDWQSGGIAVIRNEAFPSWSWAGWMNGKGQSFKFGKLQLEGPIGYLIDWYRLSDKGQQILLDDELRSKHGPAQNPPLLHPPKKRWEWKKSKGKDKNQWEPVVYTAPAMKSFNVNTFQEIASASKISCPPTSHILRFWAIGMIISVSRTNELPTNTTYGRYDLTFPGDRSKKKRYFGSVNLSSEWRAAHPDDMEFIVLSRKEKDMVTLMLVEVVGEVA